MNGHASSPAELEAALCGGELEQRLDALRALCATLRENSRRGTNTHIHTNESFSVFGSPTQAVWQAAREGVAVLGINDHYTVAGHEEFRQGCAIAGLKATLSMEAVALDRAAATAGLRLNDPDNPGRVYLSGKGITKIPPESSPAASSLARMRAALARRNREMTEKVDALLRARLNAEGPAWESVQALTPRGNATERHLARATLLRLRSLAAERRTSLVELLMTCCGAPPPDTAEAAPLETFLRSKLLKAGGPCFVQEAEDAFVSFEELRDIFLEFGAIPAYPVLGNPITPGEKDIESLLAQIEARRIFALEVIPTRNTRERLREIVRAAERRWWPVFNGTEHNTPEARPLLDPFALDPEFEPWFRQSAAALLGHQQLVAQNEPGFVDAQGSPTIGDARARLEHFRRAGS